LLAQRCSIKEVEIWDLQDEEILELLRNGRTNFDLLIAGPHNIECPKPSQAIIIPLPPQYVSSLAALSKIDSIASNIKLISYMVLLPW